MFPKVRKGSTEHRITIFALDGRIFESPIDMRHIKEFPAFGDVRSLGFKALPNLGRTIGKGAKDSDRQCALFGDRFWPAWRRLLDRPS